LLAQLLAHGGELRGFEPMARPLLCGIDAMG
jgi:hypothetical protein